MFPGLINTRANDGKIRAIVWSHAKVLPYFELLADDDGGANAAGSFRALASSRPHVNGHTIPKCGFLDALRNGRCPTTWSNSRTMRLSSKQTGRGAQCSQSDSGLAYLGARRIALFDMRVGSANNEPQGKRVETMSLTNWWCARMRL